MSDQADNRDQAPLPESYIETVADAVASYIVSPVFTSTFCTRHNPLGNIKGAFL